MLRTFILAVVIAAFASAVFAGELGYDVGVSGRQAEAIALAIRTFKSKPADMKAVYGDLRHYRVLAKGHGDRYEVTFLPDDDGHSGTGGSTDYGWEVHYTISLRSLKILKEEFAR